MTRSDRDAQARAALARIAPLCLLLLLLGAAPASAAPGWLQPADLSLPGRDASNPEIGMDNPGNTIAIWERQNVSDPSINLQIATRAPGSGFTPPTDLILKPTEPDLAVSPKGEAVAVWKRLENPPGVYVIEAATRPPGGTFSAPVTLYTAPPKVIPQEIEVALGEGGGVAVTWSEIDPTWKVGELTCEIKPGPPPFEKKCTNPPFVQASVRPAGGSFSTPVRISPPRGTRPEPPLGETEEETEEREEKEEIEESKLSATEGRVAVDPAGRVVAVWTFFDGKHTVIQTASHEGSSFSAPNPVSPSEESSGEAEVGMDSAGNAVAVWAQNEGADPVIRAAIRPPAGSFSALGKVSQSSGTSVSPSLAVNPAGTAIVAWRLAGVTGGLVQAATMPPGGAFSSPVNVSSGKDNPLFQEVAQNGAGSAVVVWSGDNSANFIVRAAVRPAGGSFSAPVAISQSSPDFFHPHVAIDLAGDATVVWTRNNGLHDIVQEAGYDGSPPELHDVSIPSSATVGESLHFSASSVDEWPIGPPHFDFGDGAAADGTSPAHAYSAPGTYLVTIGDTDAGGTTTTVTGKTYVKARNQFKIGKLSRKRAKGTATLELTVPEPGSIVVTGKGIKKATVRAPRGGTVKVPVQAAGKGLQRLKEEGKLKAKLKIAYSPTGGDTSSVGYKLTLLKKLG